MKTRLSVAPLLGVCLLLALTAPALPADDGKSEVAPAAPLTGNCPVLSGQEPLSPPAQTEPVAPLFTPDKTWASANPCFVSCPSGGFIDCSWSWSGDPTYCCWKTSTRCISYNCNTGAIALSKSC
jgi:hypothetical protein